MDKKCKKILIAIIIILVGSCILSSKVEFRLFDIGMDDRKITIKEDSTSTSSETLMKNILWFEYDKDSNIRLNVNVLLAPEVGILYYMDPKSENKSMDVKKEKLGSMMTGHFFSYADANTFDLDGDGKTDNAHIYAKTDTVDVQGFCPNKFIEQKPSSLLPFEVICHDPSELMLYSYGKPITGKVRIKSNRGMDKEFDAKNGKISFVDVRELRSGIDILYKDSSGQIYFANYLQEQHTLFTKTHMKNMITFVVLIILSVFGIIIMNIILKRGKYKQLKDYLQD